ncbi:radical SAM protein [Rhizobium sp. C4]|uniref:radical SAM protein n=1 Tax=Rhizobium sp. C4 TaxID=1349800 RepID=UPI001E536A9A|nr:radical SAM protein [Rhizobium sp. C4]MCD2175997.1 radical SAM protein [Rhizobium sp. C4]
MTGDVNPAILFSNRLLDLTLLPIEQCNFRCTYCYETFTDGKMKPELVESIRTLIDRRAPDLDYLRLGWFGGEPLLAHDIVIDLSSHARDLAERYADLEFVSGMSTNGYLLDAAMMEKLLQAGVGSFQVSIDGFGEHHDRTRVSRAGGGTFERIWANMLELRASDLDFAINLRVHYSRDNIDHVFEFTDQLKAEFGGDPRFRIFFKTIEQLGGANDKSLNVYGWKEAAEVKAQLMERLEGRMDDVLPATACYVCYAGKPNAFVIRRDGRIVKCTVGLDEPENLVGRMGHDGTMSLTAETLKPWLKGAVDLDPAFLRCPRSKMQMAAFS